jgi:hypothetical protein
MKKKLLSMYCVLVLVTCFIMAVGSYESISCCDQWSKDQINVNIYEEGYGVQWEYNYGSDPSGGRFEGPQPIGDCDNDGENELLIGGRDGTIRVMEWNENKQTYEQVHALHSPFYGLFLLREILYGESPPDPGGFAIGDLTGDGENEIAATWYAAVYKWIGGKYKVIGFNSWIFRNQGANGDCYIGDCDNDGRNELIMSGGGGSREKSIPEIVVFEWNGWRLVKTTEYNDEVYGYAFMAGLGDVDDDGDNEIVCGITSWENPSIHGNRVVVLNWNKKTEELEPTIIHTTYGWEGAPFGGWCEDSDMDGRDEIHVGYVSPRITIFEWNGTGYVTKFEKEWPGEGMLIEGLNIGDVDDDGIAEVCAGTDILHILQWNGSTYVEEATLDQTYGDLAVVIVGDCDNDGKNEINAATVFVDRDKDYMYWIFKYGWPPFG